jgi:flagellin
VSLVINTNVAALNAQRNLQQTENKLGMSMEELSSGLRINSAANDVAGYSISQELEGQIGGLNQAYQNTQSAVALTQTAQGALNDAANILQKVRSLAVEYENGSNSTASKEAIASEAEKLVSEVERVGETTKFNGVKLLEGEEAIKFQVGADEKETVEVKGGEIKSLVSGIVSEIEAGEGAGIKKVEEAIAGVSKNAAEFGAVQDRLQYIQSNQEIFSQNLAAANSSIKDVNMAEAMSNFTQEQILQQAGVAVLSQANSSPQAVLKLLGG